MRTTVKTRVLIVILFLFTNISFSNAPDAKEMLADIEERVMKSIRMKEYDEAYNYVVQAIKEREGFKSTLYYCLGGVLTIGYGHTIKNGEIFNQPITEQEAEMLLRKDLDEAIEFVKRTTDLEHFQLLAMAKFVYNVGSGNFYRSTLRQKILLKEPIDDEIVRWIKITTNNGIIESDWLLRSRQMELELFKLQT